MENSEPCIILSYLKTKLVAVKGYQDGRVESDDRNICFYPFKSKISNEKLKAMNSDNLGRYLAIANDKGVVKVFLLDKLYYDHDNKEYTSFSDHKDYVN